MKFKYLALALAATCLVIGAVGCDEPDPDPPPPDGGDPPPPPPPPPPVDGGPGVCGDGVKDPGEECDDGTENNGDGPGQCRADCSYPACGDSILDDQDPNGYLGGIVEQCDDGNLTPGDLCSPACLDEDIVAPYATVNGSVKQRDYAIANFQNNVTVNIVNANCPPDDPDGDCVSGPSAIDTGNFTIDQVPVNSAVVMQMNYPEQADFGGGLVNVPTGYATRFKAYTGPEATQTIDPYVVKLNSLAQIAVECGVYADLATALGNGNNQINPDWITYSAYMGQVKDAQGDGAAVNTVDKDRLYVRLGNEINNTVTRANDTYFCWLQDDQQGQGKLIGGGAQQNYAGGYFAIFKARNDGNATGQGNAYVGLTNLVGGLNVAESSVPVNAGMVGVVTLAEDPDAPPIDVQVSFVNEIYPLLKYDASCSACHYNGGIGYAGPNSVDLAGNPDEMYQNLVANGTTCAQEPGDYPICLDNPQYSLLLLKPLVGYDLEQGLANWHPNASWQGDNDPNFVKLRTWIEQGAYNDYEVNPLDQPYLDVVLNEINARGCNACHDYNAPSGGLALNGCDPNVDYTAFDPDFVADNNDPVSQQTCVYHQLKNQGVADDPYAYGYRLDPANPDQSMLLYNPYCGPAPNECDPAETHPLRIWPDRDNDTSYGILRSWIADGANDNYAPVE
jgi:cysteine-rich repeat protein